MTTQIPDGSVVITPAQVYNEVITLTKVVQELVATDRAETEARADLKAKVDRLDARMSTVEKKLWLITGAAATLGGGIGSFLVPLLGNVK